MCPYATVEGDGCRAGSQLRAELDICDAQVADIAAVAVMFPGALFAMAGGAIFGVPLGCALVWVGTAVGQTLAFIVGR